MFSLQRNYRRGTGWKRGGHHIKYTDQNKHVKTEPVTLDAKYVKGNASAEVKDKASIKSLRTLSFKYKFLYDFDTVFFAHFMPYSFSDHINYLACLEADERNKNKLRIDHICNSLGGLPMYGLTITD